VVKGTILGDYFIVGSLVLLCVALFGPSTKWSRWVNSLRPITDDSPYFLWKGLISSVIIAVVLIFCLVGVNSMKGAVGKVSVNIAVSVLLIGDLLILGKSVKRLRRPKG
jgi:hypothetical protein